MSDELCTFNDKSDRRNDIIKTYKSSRKKKKEWVSKWIQRRNKLGVTNTLLKELAIEDHKSFHNFLRMNEVMFIT